VRKVKHRRTNPKSGKGTVVKIAGVPEMVSSAGTSDDIEVLKSKDDITVISKNKQCGYVCCEVYDMDGGESIGLAFTQSPKEIKDLLGNPFTKSTTASKIAKKMRPYALG